MVEITDLIKLGMNKNEAKTYISLIKFRKADAHQIIQDTKFHKNIVYDNLEKLIDKGLVTFILEGNKRIFQLTSANALIDNIEEEQKELGRQKKKAIEISKEIEKSLKLIPQKQEAMIYRGVKGIKSFYNETLKGKDFVTFGGPQKSIDLMGETFWYNYDIKRAEKKIKARLIFNYSIKHHGAKIKNKFTEVKYFNKEFEPNTETHIQDDKVGVIVWGDEPILFLIQDKSVAESYKKYFENMWKQAKS